MPKRNVVGVVFEEDTIALAQRLRREFPGARVPSLSAIIRAAVKIGLPRVESAIREARSS